MNTTTLSNRLGLVALLAASSCTRTPTLVSAPGAVIRSFSASGIKTVVLRAGGAETAVVQITGAGSPIVVSGVPSGGASGYHPSDAWRETPAAKWGLDFVSKQFGSVLVISSKNELSYIHHHYSFQDLRIALPKSDRADTCGT